MSGLARGDVVRSGYRTVAEHDRICARAGYVPSPHDGPFIHVKLAFDSTQLQETLRKAEFEMRKLGAALRGELPWFLFGVELRRLNAIRLGTKP